MKNRRALSMMALAVVFGLAAVALASHWLLGQAPGAGNRIVVAAADVSLGQRLAPEMMKTLDWPADSLPHGALRDPVKLVGRVLKSSVLRDEPLSEAKLAPAGTVGGLSALITEGNRAITVRVNDVVGVAGFALPGNFVDILVNTQSARGGDNAISKIVLERILVLAVAQEVGPQGIRINNLYPGIIDTPMFHRLDDDKALAGFAAATPLRRAGLPADVGDVAEWLCTDEARFVTGQSLMVDGGFTLTSM